MTADLIRRPSPPHIRLYPALVHSIPINSRVCCDWVRASCVCMCVRARALQMRCWAAK